MTGVLHFPLIRYKKSRVKVEQKRSLLTQTACSFRLRTLLIQPGAP